MTVDGRIEQGIQSERITAPIEKKGLKEKKKMLIMSRMGIKVKIKISKITTLKPLCPK